MGFQHYKKFLWCFIGFIVAMKLVKRILGNNNFDSLSSTSLTCFSGCRFSFSFSFTTWISEDEIKNQKMTTHKLYLYYKYSLFDYPHHLCQKRNKLSKNFVTLKHNNKNNQSPI